MSRPEHLAPPELFYNRKEARKYDTSSRMINIQRELTSRAIELLMLPPGEQHLILDVGCGSGISGEVVEESGCNLIGMDISPDMLDVANERELKGDLLLHDMGQGLPYRVGIFDGIISISAVQWLCYSNKKQEIPHKRLTCFFRTLYFSLKRGARAAIQLYPETAEQLELITSVAMKCGFTGGVVVDYPNSKKAKKIYLCLIAGEPDEKREMPTALGGGGEHSVKYESRREKARKKGRKFKHGKERMVYKSRDWVLAKKERQRKQGRAVKRDSKFSGRRRAARF
eukprot:g995.t1